MTREEQLKFCKICNHRTFTFNQGLVCGLTSSPANFETTCANYSENEVLKQKQNATAGKNEIADKTATHGQRLANYLIDFVLFLLFSFLFGSFMGVSLAIFSPSSIYIFEQDNLLFDYAFGFITGVFYYSTLEFATGRTIGKYVTKTKVIDENGNKPGYGVILTRSVCRFIPFEAFSFLGSSNQGWHDKLSKTRVVSVNYNS